MHVPLIGVMFDTVQLFSPAHFIATLQVSVRIYIMCKQNNYTCICIDSWFQSLNYLETNHVN